MKNDSKILLQNIDKVHTTKMGLDRIRKNLKLNVVDVVDVVEWCKTKIKDEQSSITKEGKNWYVTCEKYIITVNASSYTIITAHNS